MVLARSLAVRSLREAGRGGADVVGAGGRIDAEIGADAPTRYEKALRGLFELCLRKMRFSDARFVATLVDKSRGADEMMMRVLALQGAEGDGHLDADLAHDQDDVRERCIGLADAATLARENPKLADLSDLLQRWNALLEAEGNGIQVKGARDRVQ